jgi:hypothetical protein
MPLSTDTDTQASSLTITELTGDQRVVVLSGRALPYKPFTLGGSQRMSMQWYIGNPNGVKQVYGAEEEETTCNGWWKDIFLGEAVGHPPYATLNGGQLGTAEHLVDVLDDIRRKGQDVKVTWFSRVRFGTLKKLVQKWHTTHDVEFEMTFAWDRIDEASLPKIPLESSVSSSDLADAPNTFTSLGNQLQDASASFANGFSPAAQVAADDTDDMSADLSDQIDELADAVTQVVGAAVAVGDTQSRISGIYDGIKLTGDELHDQYQNVVDGARLDVGGPFGTTLADRAVVRDQGDIADQIAVTAAQGQRKILSAMTSNNLRVFVARQGDDLRRVSMTFYGTADDWRGIMLYNALSDEALVAGQVVLVPVQPPQEPASS